MTTIRTFFGISLLLLLVACSGNPSAETENGAKTAPVANQQPEQQPIQESDGEDVKDVLEKLLGLVHKDNFADAAPLIAYRGDDQARRWKSTCNYQAEDEKQYVDKLCAKLQALQSGLEKKQYLEFIREKESEGEWNVWVVQLIYEDGNKEETAFAFLKIGDSYALGDID